MQTKALALVLSGVSLVAASSAFALPLYQHASSFQAVVGSDQQFINHSTIGVYNTATVVKRVIGAPPRNPHASGNQLLSVSGSNIGAADTRCTMYALNTGGSPFLTKSFCVGSSAGCVPALSPWMHSEVFPVFTGSYAVVCTLLPTGVNTNRVHSVRVTP